MAESAAVKTTWKHVYHGIALAQLVESGRFTALNRVGNTEGLYLVNHDRRLLVKYDSEGADGRFAFTLNRGERTLLDGARRASEGGVFIALVCADLAVCGLTLDELKSIVSWSASGSQSIGVLLEEGKSMSVTGSAGQLPYKVPHSGPNGFPEKILE